MTIDGEPSYRQPVFLPKAASNIFGHEGAFLAIGKLRLEEECSNEDFFSSTSSVGRKSSDSADPSLHVDDSRRGMYFSMESPNTGRNMSEFFRIELPAMESEAEIYNDNIIVHSTSGDIFKDGACYDVKDICVDEGIFNEKIMIEAEAVIEKSCTSTLPVMDDNEATEEGPDIKDPVLDCAKHSDTNGHSICAFHADALEKYSSGSNPGKCGGKLDGCSDHIEDEVSDVKIQIEKSIPEQAFSLGQQKYGQSNLEEVSFPSAAISLTDSCNESNEKERPGYGEAEAMAITKDFNSGTSVLLLSSRPQGKEQPRRNGTDEASGGTSILPRNSFGHHYRGDSASSVPNFLHEPMTSSGPIPFSGNISHRSDSSTTSARSFAFPILQSEWTSSPVKMVKADRRHFRRRRWRFGLFCCKS